MKPMWSAVGGALDFIRAANQSYGGVSIIALPASGKNFSRIVSHLQGPVSTPRSDAGLIITEYGICRFTRFKHSPTR